MLKYCMATIFFISCYGHIYAILPTLKFVQYFAYSLFYACTVNLLNKKDMSRGSVFELNSI